MLQSSPSIAFFEALIIVISIGIITGKLSIAIKEKLLFVFEAIAAVKVRVQAIEILPKKRIKIKSPISCMMLPINNK